MAHWKREEALLTLGGCNSNDLSEVKEYLVEKDKWVSGLPDLP